MLFYGNPANIQDQCLVFNYTSYIEGYRRLNLIPPNSLGASDEYQFDQFFMQWIFSNDFLFMELFSVVMALHDGKDVYIIVSDDDWSEMLIESLLKLIQQRYGYNATRVNCFDDVLSAGMSDINTSYGVFNFDQDFERYEYIVAAINLANGGG